MHYKCAMKLHYQMISFHHSIVTPNCQMQFILLVCYDESMCKAMISANEALLQYCLC